MQWLTAGHQAGLKPATIHQRRSSVTSYARFAQVGGRDFMAYYRPPRRMPADPHPIPEGMPGVERLLDACTEFHQIGLVVLCGWMGLRVNEAVTVPASAVDLDELVLRVDGKGAKRRILPLYDRTIGHVMALSGAQGFSDAPMVPMGNSTARALVTRLGRAAGLSRPISSHDLRATFATDLYDRTKDVVAVQQWMGHADLATTMRYIGSDLKRMRLAVAGVS